ncbi:tryptophan 2,3-dioxygenase family protein [Streptomyces subrutilus]|uniref:Tryptophan 2,3-dioxygenase n=1 Tax=Streptomyces subrutilus TaxID=36818 RepID=A0A918QSV3_9ACTN|nr:tryptophan 2,3-dioxygenase family protein [Streptomyces subrutilus]WSJ31009.1 tryptophan 2,3-dioxygenase family protein [Streptomyces subrutilus]GGZ67937.1 tryptophan 2,3-dioxygenase [Streptomyces subrutilus]
MNATAEAPPYGRILRLEELLEAACVREDDVERVLFLATHQSCEIFFAVVLRHLQDVREALDAGDGFLAARRAAPLPVIFRTLVGQFDGLATLTPAAFEAIRTALGEASGFQSAQFREIEYLCGLRDTRFLNTAGFSAAERERLRTRLEERSVQEAYRDYTAGGPDREAADAARRALLDFDEAMALWRARHAVLAERFLGGTAGTAGSDGASYLWAAARRRVLPEVWAELA